MIIGSFTDDLDLYIAENKGQSKASKASSKDLLLMGVKGTGVLDQGRMYTFRYFTEDETFYDTFPIVIGLGAVPGSMTNQLGINLHYIPYDARIPFMEDIIKSFSGFFERQFNNAGEVAKQTFNKDFTYEAVKKSLGRKYNLTYAIRQYRLDRMKDPKIIGYEDWYLGAVNDDNFFFGGSILQAQDLYYQNI
jgi:hypothetical protein